MPHFFSIDPVAIVLLLMFIALALFALTSPGGRRLLIGCAVVLFAVLAMGCKPADTKVVVDTRPPVKIEVTRYVPVDPKLTAPTPIAEGSIEQVLDVARERKTQLIGCNADKAAIADIQGTPVKKPC